MREPKIEQDRPVDVRQADVLGLDVGMNEALAMQRRQGKWQESLEEYERVQKTDPQNPNTVRELVFTNTAQRRWPEASRWARQMRTMAPASLVAKIQSGYVDFWWKGDTGPLKSMLSQVPAGTDPDGSVTSCRWDVPGMRLNDTYATGQRPEATPLLRAVRFQRG